jgi:hypothetical protein
MANRAVTLMNYIEYAVFVVVFFLTEVPLLLSVVAIYQKIGVYTRGRHWQVQQPQKRT